MASNKRKLKESSDTLEYDDATDTWVSVSKASNPVKKARANITASSSASEDHSKKPGKSSTTSYPPPAQLASTPSTSRLLTSLDALDSSFRTNKEITTAKKSRIKTQTAPQSSYSQSYPSLPSSVNISRKSTVTSTASASQQPTSPDPKQPKPKASRKKNSDDEPAPEKRLARYKKSCPKAIEERVDRVTSQRFVLIDRERKTPHSEEFSVLGSTGNVYTVTIAHLPKCTCPDSQKGNHCKHLLFIFMKVLSANFYTGLWYQKALLTSELETLFAEARDPPRAVYDLKVTEAYEVATGKKSSATVSTATQKGQKRIPGPGDDCPICYDTMEGTAESALTFCKECGNAMHSPCWAQWKATVAKQGKPMTCVWCRAKWVDTSGGVGSSRSSGGYINLAATAGISRERDTSTYYNGTRRGERYYGYQVYDSD